MKNDGAFPYDSYSFARGTDLSVRTKFRSNISTATVDYF